MKVLVDFTKIPLTPTRDLENMEAIADGIDILEALVSSDDPKRDHLLIAQIRQVRALVAESYEKLNDGQFCGRLAHSVKIR